MNLLSRHPLAVLLVMGLVLFVPGFSTLPPQDRDEPRFAQASKQMLETSDFVAIRFGDDARNKKPVGIYWLQSAAVRLGEIAGVQDARRTIWLYRLPSLAGALATILFTYWAARAFTSRRDALLAGLLTAATALLGVEARLATTDAVVAATVAASMGALARAYRDRGSGKRLDLTSCLLFWLALGIGVLVKGPITPMVPLLAAIVLSVKARDMRWLRALRPLPGLLVCLAIVLPWLVLILVRTQGGFLADSLGHDMIGKIAAGQEEHGLPPGSYLLAFWLSGWPMAPFVALAAPMVWRIRREEPTAFLLAWLVPAWLVFEAVPTKLFHYVLPLYPALAILVVIALRRSLAAFRFGPMALGLFIGLMTTVPLVLLGATYVFQSRVITVDSLTAGLGIAATLCAALFAWQAARSLRGQSLPRAIAWAVLAALPTYLYGLAWLPGPSVAVAAALSPRLAEAARDALGAGCQSPAYATVGDREPSLMFLTSTELVMTDAEGAARFMGEGPCRAAFVDASAEPAFSAALDAALPVTLTQHVAGIALNGGKPLDIGVYVRQ